MCFIVKQEPFFPEGKLFFFTVNPSSTMAALVLGIFAISNKIRFQDSNKYQKKYSTIPDQDTRNSLFYLYQNP